MLITMIFSIAMVKLQFSSSLHLQKCCKTHQRLSTDLKSCVNLHAESEHQDSKINSSYEYNWHLPNDTKILSTQHLQPVNSSSPVKIELEIILQTNDSEKYFFQSRKNVFALDEKISFFDNGSSLLTNKMLHSGINPGVYPYWSYCLDDIFTEESSRLREQSYNFNFIVILQPYCKFQCIQKCCPESMYLLVHQRCHHSSNVPKDWIYQILPADMRNNYEIIDQPPQCEDLKNLSLNLSTFTLSANDGVKVKELSKAGHLDNYCIYQPMMNDSSYEEVTSLRCRSMQSQIIEILYIIYYVIGSVFLAATLLVYGLVRELRRTFYARIMMSHVTCLFACYLIMIINNINKPKNNTLVCIIVAYALQFLFLAAIFWLNVMCFYISRMFKIKATLQPTHTFLTKNKAYFLYSVYVWGMTSAISIGTYFADRMNFISEDIKPQMGLRQCWFTGKPAKFLYFYLPVTVVLLVNLVLFLFTMKGVLEVQKESRKIIVNRDSNKHKGNKPVACESKQFYKLRLSIKLCALMGITWLSEIVSWAVDGPEYYWYATDAINSLRGFFIFIICCCKKKVFKLLWNQLCRKGSQNQIEINDYYRTPANNPVLARRLTISSETDSAYQLTVRSTQAIRKPSLPR